jgi:hypothetical protein
MGTINAIKLTITSHLFNQSIGILGNRIKKIPPTLIYNLNDRTVVSFAQRNFFSFCASSPPNLRVRFTSTHGSCVPRPLRTYA